MEKETFSLIAVALMFLSRGIYFKKMYDGTTRPHAFSWLIWGLISSIGVAAQIVEGAGVGSWPRLFGAVTCFIVVVFAFHMGEKNITRGDKITLAVALAAIPLWIVTKTPVWSVILVCIIDTIGYLPTVRKSWEKPMEEPASGYLISAFGAFFSLLAIENYTLSTWLYPAVLTITNFAMPTYLVMRRRTVLKLAV